MNHDYYGDVPHPSARNYYPGENTISVEDLLPGSFKNTKSIMDHFYKHLSVDQNLHKTIHKFEQGFVYRNEEHINFFGSNLTGVYAVRFKTSDRNDILIDIFDVEESEIRKEIVKLDAVGETWVRGTDVLNLSCLYLTHRALKNEKLSVKQRHDLAKSLLMVMHFKLIGSLMSRYFPHPVDPRLAQMTYAAMSKKFSIKQCGSWYKVLEARCEDILSTSSIHKRTLDRFDDDGAIQNMITDIQGRLKNMLKKIWKLFEEVRSKDNKLMTVTGTIDLDGKTVVRDLIRNETQYIRYINEVAMDQQRFIKKELIVVISDVMQTMPDKLLYDALVHVSEKMRKNDKKTQELLGEVLLHAFDYFSKDRYASMKLNDLGTLLIKFRALYVASRSKEEKLLTMRDNAEKLVTESVKSKNSVVIASVRTGLLLYILLRSFSMNHYK